MYVLVSSHEWSYAASVEVIYPYAFLHTHMHYATLHAPSIGVSYSKNMKDNKSVFQ